MIKDKLINAKTYYSLSENIKKGFEWLNSADLDNINDGKYYIDGDKLYANVQTYETKEDADYEAHRKYIDIQYIVRGRECIGVTDIGNCVSCKQYNPEKDIEFFTCNETSQYQLLQEGEFMLLYPHDAHKPSINPNEKQTVKKVVVKALI